MKKINFKCLLFAIMPIILVGGLGAIFTNGGQDWYDKLILPNEWPVSYIFPIMWNLIYLLFIIVIYLMCIKKQFDTETISLLIINGVLNVVWCLIFFGLNLIFIGQIVIIFNLIFAMLLFSKLYSVKKYYAYMILIYIIWIGIATSLNTAIWILN